MVRAETVLGRYLVAGFDPLDYDEPEDPTEGPKSAEYAFWDALDDAFQRMVKRSVKPLITNPALDPDLAAELSLIFEKGQGDGFDYNSLWMKLPHSACREATAFCEALDRDWEYYRKEMAARQRKIKPKLDGRAWRDARTQCEGVLLSIERYFESLREMRDENPIYAYMRANAGAKWQGACDGMRRLARRWAEAVAYLTHDPFVDDLGSTFRSAVTELHRQYKAEVLPQYWGARREICPLAIDIEAMSEGLDRYRSTVERAKKAWETSSPLLRAVEQEKANYDRMLDDAQGTGPDTPMEKAKALAQERRRLTDGIFALEKIKSDAKILVSEYFGWPSQNPKLDLAGEFEAIKRTQQTVYVGV
jgi:hypothetical protein